MLCRAILGWNSKQTCCAYAKMAYDLIEQSCNIAIQRLVSGQSRGPTDILGSYC